MMAQFVSGFDHTKLLQIRLRQFMSWLLAACATLAVLMTFSLLRTPG
jgi:hypothetical protein